MAAILETLRVSNAFYLVVDAAPATGGGTKAGINSLALGPTGITYQKDGPLDTDWTAVATPGGSQILAFESTPTVGGAVQETVAVVGLLATDTILSVSQQTFGAATRTSLPLIGWSGVADDSITLDWIADPGPGAVVVIAVSR